MHTPEKAAHSKAKANCVLSFRHQCMTKRRIKKSAKKGLFKARKLCYSIGEAESGLLGWLTSVFSAWSNWRNKLHKHGFNIRWGGILKEEFKANVYSVREINLIGMFSLALLNDYGVCDQFAEVVHSELCKDFLENELHLFCVEM